MYTWQKLGPEEALFGHKGLSSPLGCCTSVCTSPSGTFFTDIYIAFYLSWETEESAKLPRLLFLSGKNWVSEDPGRYSHMRQNLPKSNPPKERLQHITGDQK